MLQRANIQNIYRLSPLQKHIYYQYLTDSQSTSYFQQNSSTIHGNISEQRVRECFAELVARHDALRTVFVQQKDDLLQVVLKQVDIDVIYQDISDELDSESYLALLKKADKQKGFNLNREILARLSLIKYDDDRFVLIWSSHHIVLDGWSIANLQREFMQLYLHPDKKLPSLPQYNSYIKWLEQGDRSEGESYWHEYLEAYEGNASIIKSTTSLSLNRSCFTLKLSRELTFRLTQLAQSQFTTMNVLLQTSWGILLAEYNDSNDVVFGSVVSGRPAEIADIDHIIGLFINTVPTRVKFDSGTTFDALLRSVHGHCFRSEKYHDVDLTNVLFYKGLFDHLFIYESYPAASLEDGELQVINNESEVHTTFDLNVLVVPKEELELQFEYNSGSYSSDSITRLAVHFKGLLEKITKNPLQLVEDLTLMSSHEMEGLQNRYNKAKPKRYSQPCVQDWFQSRVQLFPDRIAVEAGDINLTYQELNDKSDEVAVLLRNLGIRRGDNVALMMDQSLELLVGMLGIFKSGGVYVPIDPEFAAEYIQYILKDSAAALLLTNSSTSLVKLGSGTRVVKLDHKQSLQVAPNENLVFASELGDVAYIIYDYVSSGEPKGVTFDYSSMMTRMEWIFDANPLKEDDVVLQMRSITSSGSIWGMLMGLNGGRISIHTDKQDKDLKQIEELISKSRVTIAHFLPSKLQALLQGMHDGIIAMTSLSSLRTIITSGEELREAIIQQLYEQLGESAIRLMNMYGPTESGECISYLCEQKDEGGFGVIGKPFCNEGIYIVNRFGRLCPIGVPGEIWVAGALLSRGYWNDHNLTDSTYFYSDNYGGERMYRTGSLACWESDGNLRYLGKLDRLFTTSGNRININEVEHVLRSLSGIHEAVVTQTNGMLYAYYTKFESVGMLGESIMRESMELKQLLAAKLPDYMLPSRFYCVNEFPLLGNGDIDRSALHVFNSLRDMDQSISTDTEKRLCNLWERVLKLEAGAIDRGSHFFHLGGHSLRVITLILSVHKEFEVKLKPSVVFQYPTLEEMATLIDKQLMTGSLKIMPALVKERYETSPSQRRLYFLQQLHPESSLYHISIAKQVNFTLHLSRLQESVRRMVERHEVLRTTIESNAHGIFQIIHESMDIPILYHRLLDEQLNDTESLHSLRNNPFHLEKGPLLRIGVFEQPDGISTILLTMHHIIVDAVSIDLLLQELLNLYRGHEVSPILLQYKDYSEWLKTEEKQSIAEQEAFWLEHIGINDISILNLPSDRSRPSLFTGEGESITFLLPEDVVNRLKIRAAASNATMFMTLFALYGVFLSKITGNEDFIVGIPAVFRPHDDLKHTIGNFLNSLAIRTRPMWDKSFSTYLDHAKDILHGALDNQLYPFEELISKLKIDRDASRNPLFDVFFSYVNKGVDRQHSVDIIPISVSNRNAKYDLSFYCMEEGKQIQIDVEYYTGVYQRETIKRYVEYFLNIVKYALQNPDAPIGCIPFYQEMHLGEKELQGDERDPLYIHEQFSIVAKRYPELTAIVYGDKTMTYAQLEETSEQISEELKRLHVVRNESVGILMHKSPEAIAAMIGVIKSGGCYVPLDPNYPEERINYIVKNSGMRTIITGADQGVHGEMLFEGSSIRTLSVVSGETEATGYKLMVVGELNVTIESKAARDDIKMPASEAIMYIMYTSGSTGWPKGVMVTHANAANLLEWTVREFGISNVDRMMLLSSISFDISVLEIFAALLGGAQLHILSDNVHRDPVLLDGYLQHAGITIWHSVPSFIAQLLNVAEHRPNAQYRLRHVILGGEAWGVGLGIAIQQRFSMARLTNVYGPTETTVWVSSYTIEESLTENSKIPIGQAIDHNRLYVMDSYYNVCGIGIEGELFISGANVTKGYYQDEEKTRESFIQHPVYGLLYKTGDRVKHLSSGSIEFIGRKDFMIKVRGYRVDVSEVERAIRLVHGMKTAVVIAKKDGSTHRLIACVHSDIRLERSAIFNKLKQHLPQYMIPSEIVFLEKIPLTPNGKIDRKAIASVVLTESNSARHSHGLVEPLSETASKLMSIWESLLEKTGIELDDDFFEIGGDSMKLSRMFSEIQQIFGQKLLFHQLFNGRTIRSIEALLHPDANGCDHKIVEIEF